MADEPLAERPDAAVEDLPPSAHPPVRPEDPAPLDDMPVPPLTHPDETRGG